MGAKVRISEGKAKFIWAFQSGSTFGPAKGTKKRMQNKICPHFFMRIKKVQHKMCHTLVLFSLFIQFQWLKNMRLVIHIHTVDEHTLYVVDFVCRTAISNVITWIIEVETVTECLDTVFD